MECRGGRIDDDNVMNDNVAEIIILYTCGNYYIPLLLLVILWPLLLILHHIIPPLHFVVWCWTWSNLSDFKICSQVTTRSNIKKLVTLLFRKDWDNHEMKQKTFRIVKEWIFVTVHLLIFCSISCEMLVPASLHISRSQQFIFMVLSWYLKMKNNRQSQINCFISRWCGIERGFSFLFLFSI